jgi:Mlc titration factor MtfA (ptsG expression regulator)
MFLTILISGTVLYIIYRFKLELQEGYDYVDRAAAPVKSKLLPVPKDVKEVLVKYFTYYNQLSGENKRKFEQKLCHFIYSKRFIPRNTTEVTLEAKVLISACAVQLTFGLPNIYLTHFSKILVYPDEYYSSITKRFHKGEVNPAFGAIVLSWKSFVDGYIYPTDSINLGLHEMAHALRLENIIYNEEYHFFDEALIEQLDDFARRICTSEEFTGEYFLREYACTNVHEFFAVSVENFFERPVKFKHALPELYSILAKLLNQDPASLTA